MTALAKATLAGIAFEGFAAVIVKANQFALQKLWELNRIAVGTALNMFITTLTNIRNKEVARRIVNEEKEKLWQQVWRSGLQRKEKEDDEDDSEDKV